MGDVRKGAVVQIQVVFPFNREAAVEEAEALVDYMNDFHAIEYMYSRKVTGYAYVDKVYDATIEVDDDYLIANVRVEE